MILVNVGDYLGPQSSDPVRFERALEVYHQEQLAPFEAPAYQAYLRRQQGAEETQEEVFRAIEQEDWQALAPLMLGDPGFYQYARQNGHLHWQPERFADWRTVRGNIQNEHLAHLSSRAHGLTPARLEPADLVSYAFLHGGLAHLLGNMLFLFLLGFTVEKALGTSRYLLAYVLCGAVAGLTHVAVHSGSFMPLVGASGAVSGLMGMYLALFGRRRIRFFYFLGVYLGYFRAPALALLPVWLGKELYDYWAQAGSPVAYMAHAGGLLTGAALVGLFGRSVFQAREDFFEPEEDEKEAAFRRRYARALEELASFRFDRAREQFEVLWQAHPDRPVLLEHLYHLDKLRPQDSAFGERAAQMLDHCLRTHQHDRLFDIWREAVRLAGVEQLPARIHSKVLFASLKSGALKQAEKAFDALRRGGEPVLCEEAARLLAEEFDKRGMKSKARQYRELLGTLEQG